MTEEHGPQPAWPRIIGGLLLALMLVLAPAASAQALLGAIMDVSVEDSARVRLTFTVALPDSTDHLPLRSLMFDGQRPQDVTVDLGGGPQPVALHATSPALAGTVALPPRPPAPDTLEVQVTYALAIEPEEASFDISVPVVYVDALPAAAAEDFFVATLHLPASYVLTETFPTTPGDRYRLSLQVLPSLVRLRGFIGTAPWLTTLQWVDLAVGVLLLLGGALGWRQMRRSTS